jgi:chorismate synthase
MRQNTIGENFCLTLFGGSHQGFIGGVIEGCPKGIKVEMSFIEEELERRKAKEKYETTRKEKDEVIFLQGLDKGITLGNDIRFVIENKDVNKSSYNDFQGLFRPSHCDYTYFLNTKKTVFNSKIWLRHVIRLFMLLQEVLLRLILKNWVLR